MRAQLGIFRSHFETFLSRPSISSFMSSTSHQGVKSSSQSLYHKIDPSVLHRLLLGYPRVLRLPIKYHANSLSGLHKRGRLPGYTRYEIGKFSRDIYGLDLSQQLRAWPPARKPRMVSSSGNTETPELFWAVSYWRNRAQITRGPSPRIPFASKYRGRFRAGCGGALGGDMGDNGQPIDRQRALQLPRIHGLGWAISCRKPK